MPFYMKNDKLKFNFEVLYTLSSFSNRTAFRLSDYYIWKVSECVSECVSVCVNDNFEPCDWSTRLPEFKTGSAVQTGIQQSV